MNHILLHIPHASDRIPSYEDFVSSRERIRQEVELLTDWHTDELFPTEQYHSIIAGFSRVFCDVERFADDNKEVMAKCGMGVLYEKTDDGTLMREVDKDLRQKILNNYYWKHHHQLNTLCEKLLNKYDKLLIIDCHSFTDTPLQEPVYFFRSLANHP